MDEAIQTRTIFLLGDGLGDVSDQHIEVPIQQDVPLNDGVEVREETCGDKLVLDTLQREDKRLDSDKTDVALDGLQHLETMITKIAQLAL